MLGKRRYVVPQKRNSLLARILVVIGAIVFTVPLVWCLSVSLRDTQQMSTHPEQMLPSNLLSASEWKSFLRVRNYTEAWYAFTEIPGRENLTFFVFFRNTALITLFSVVGTVASASLVAFAFARMRFKGRNILFMLMLSTMFLPAQVTMITTFMLWDKLHLIDTWGPLIIPSFFGGGAFNIFLLRQFFLTIPKGLDEAALIDGCSYLGIYRHVIMPLSVPAIITIALFSFMGNWNNLMGPLIYLNTMSKYTASIALKLFSDQYGRADVPHLMAASMLNTIPMLVLFFIGQRYFIKGVQLSGLKQ